MSNFTVEAWRGDMVESVHRVTVAVVQDGELVASAGDTALVTYWRSAAKPFQAMPFVADGAMDRFGLGEEELALACASHSSEPAHVALAQRFLNSIGCTERDLACGGHPPLSSAEADRLMRAGIEPTPVFSNCSGKHTAMLAMAKVADWPLEGYNQADHPLQQRLLEEVAHWTGVPSRQIRLAIDGCNVPCYGIPLVAMARAYGRLATSEDDSAVKVRRAMTSHPFLVGGTDRPCSDLMKVGGGAVLAKIGAEGIYGCALPSERLGIALKIEDGSIRSAPVALLGVLAALRDRGLAPAAVGRWLEQLSRHAEVPLTNTRGVVTGRLTAAGELEFVAS